MDWRSSDRGHSEHRRHRKRRFHVHPAARGLGRYACQTAAAVSPTEEVNPAPETEAREEKQRAHATARKGLWVMAWVMLFLLACVRFGVFFRVYSWLVDTWMTLVTGTNVS